MWLRFNYLEAYIYLIDNNMQKGYYHVSFATCLSVLNCFINWIIKENWQYLFQLNIIMISVWIEDNRRSNWGHLRNISFPIHKNPLKFKTVTVGCIYYNMPVNTLFLNILTPINKKALEKNIHCIKNSFELVVKSQTLKEVKNIVTYNFKNFLLYNVLKTFIYIF